MLLGLQACLRASYLLLPGQHAVDTLGCLPLHCPRCRRGLLAATTFGLQAAYVHLLHGWHLLFREPGGAPWPLQATRLHIALLSFGSPFIAALIAAALLALMLHADPLHARVAQLLGAAVWRPLANLSYCQYLLHEQARLWVVLLLLPSGLLPRLIVGWPVPSFICICAASLGAGYMCALVLHHLVEKRWASSAATAS